MHAKQYIDTVMMNIQQQLGNEQTFPTKFGKEKSVIEKISTTTKIIMGILLTSDTRL